MDDAVSYRLDGHIATITLNRPEVRNAMTLESYALLARLLAGAEADPQVRCIVVTGSGAAFCSGDDVRELLSETGSAELSRRFSSGDLIVPTLAMLSLYKPIIGAINGPAVGWGMELAILCDIRIASEQARFGELFVRRGLIPDVPGLAILPRLVGPEVAARLLFTGDIIDARQAREIRLVSEVVPHAELMPGVYRLAKRIARNPPLAVKEIKRAMRLAQQLPLQLLGDQFAQSNAGLLQTMDHREGVRAFLEKRQPRFEGR